MKAILHPRWMDDCIKNIKRRRFTDSADGQAMMCEAKVFCDEQTYYMSILDSDIPEFRIGRSPIIHRGVEGFKSDDVMHVVEDSPSRIKKVGVTNIKFEDFRDNFVLGLKRFVRHPSRKPEEFGQEYTEQFRRRIKRKIKAYERAKERHARQNG